MKLEVKLSKKSWHYKLQSFTFGINQPELYSLCPYFWLTIFCMLISPITIIVKPIKYLVKKSKERRLAREEKELQEFISNLSVDSIVEAVKKKKKIGWMEFGYCNVWDVLRRWQHKYNATEDECYAFHEKINNKLYDIENELKIKKMAKENAKIEAKLKRNQKVNVTNIVKYTKLFVGMLVSTLLTFLIYKGIVALISIEWQPINWEKVLVFFMTLLVIIIFVSIIFFLVGFIKSIEKYIEGRDDIKWYYKPALWIFKCVFWIIKWPFIAIIEVFKFIFGYFKSTKDNYCPGIIWEEEQNVQK